MNAKVKSRSPCKCPFKTHRLPCIHKIVNNFNEIYNIPKVIKMFPKDIVFNSFIGVRGLLFKSNRIRDNVITYKKVKKI